MSKIVLVCPECGEEIFSGRAAYYHFRMEHQFSRDEAYETVGDLYDQFNTDQQQENARRYVDSVFSQL